MALSLEQAVQLGLEDGTRSPNTALTRSRRADPEPPGLALVDPQDLVNADTKGLDASGPPV
jgi:hypothetical protein